MKHAKTLDAIESEVTAMAQRERRGPALNFNRLGNVALARTIYLRQKRRAGHNFKADERAELDFLSAAVAPGSTAPTPAGWTWGEDMQSLGDRPGVGVISVWYANERLKPHPKLIDGFYRLSAKDAELILEYCRRDEAGRAALIEERKRSEVFPMDSPIGFSPGSRYGANMYGSDDE